VYRVLGTISAFRLDHNWRRLIERHAHFFTQTFVDALALRRRSGARPRLLTGHFML
jgi:hypothetical protein